MSTLDLCEKYFKTRDIYKLFQIAKNALPKDIKKSYYQLSLKVHPDRVDENEKEIATEKFKILSKLYQTLCDKDKRATYDEQGIIDDEDDFDGKLHSWLELWRKLFKPLSIEDINNYEKSYIGSELERNDIKKAYINFKGCIDRMHDEVPFMRVEDEPRIQKIVKEMIDANEVPHFKIFTHEPDQKRKRRYKKYARESKEANDIKNKMGEDNLEKMVMERNRARQESFANLMDRLTAKYGDGDDEDCEEFQLPKKNVKKREAIKNNSVGDEKLNGVKKGRVSKKN